MEHFLEIERDFRARCADLGDAQVKFKVVYTRATKGVKGANMASKGATSTDSIRIR